MKKGFSGLIVGLLAVGLVILPACSKTDQTKKGKPTPDQAIEMLKEGIVVSFVVSPAVLI